MNIQILDSWLREHLNTKASAQQIAKYVSLSGPTFDRATKINKDYLYDIEVTSNRVDAMSVAGIAREAAVILPQFKIPAKRRPVKLAAPPHLKKSLPFKVVSNKKLVSRTIAVVIDDISNWESPNWLKKRLEATGIRSLNAPVDITNYVMVELGHPMHVFDYDKIKDATIVIRQSKKGEKITSLENKTYNLPGGDIIFESVDGEIIDLPGIIGTKNSVVSKKTKRFLFFIDNNDSARIRKTSMTLGIRTNAAVLNEKGVDPELGMEAILRALYLVDKICKGKPVSKIYDSYLTPLKKKTVKTTHEFITQRLGVEIPKKEIAKILKYLEFEPQWQANKLTAGVPSFRNGDISIAEDIVEEVARIWGYHKLPSILPKGGIPERVFNSPFAFEKKIKNLLAGWGGAEIYTFSLVPENWVTKKALKLKNPLGKETEYLRTSLLSSLVDAGKANKGQKDPFHIFEIANIYLPTSRKSLPQETMVLAGLFSGYNFREAKGVVEALLTKLNIKYQEIVEDENKFLPSRRIAIRAGKEKLGEFGELKNGFHFYSFEIEKLKKKTKSVTTYKFEPQYPAQIEDLTFVLPEKTKTAELISFIEKEKFITQVELEDVFKNAYTFRLWYQSPQKTLTDEEVEKIRKSLLTKLEKKFGAIFKN